MVPEGIQVMELSRGEKAWVKLKWEKIRASQRAADAANNEWQELNRAINAKLDAEREYDIVQRTKIKSASIPLADALSTGNWHSRNAERHIHDLQLFLQLKREGLL